VTASEIVVVTDDAQQHVIPFAAIAHANYQHDFAAAAGLRRSARRGTSRGARRSEAR
jgi:hypothetical protein